MKINGAVLPYSQTLFYGGYEFLDLQDIFVGAMILASSGAVMDLAMTSPPASTRSPVIRPGSPPGR